MNIFDRPLSESKTPRPMFDAATSVTPVLDTDFVPMDADMEEMLWTLVPAFVGDLLSTDRLVLTGGALRGALRPGYRLPRDFDLLPTEHQTPEFWADILRGRGANNVAISPWSAHGTIEVVGVPISVQIITARGHNPREAMKHFDFTSCMIALGGRGGIIHKDALEQIQAEEMVLSGATLVDPVDTARRMVRFASRGWKICRSDLTEVLYRVGTMEPDTRRAALFSTGVS